jgi:hypothetical protein
MPFGGSRPSERYSDGIEIQEEVVMFRAKPAGTVPAVDSGGRSHCRGGAGRLSRGSGAAMGALGRVVHLIVGNAVLIIVAVRGTMGRAVGGHDY